MGAKKLNEDVKFVLAMGEKHLYLDTISTLFLNEFHDDHTKCNSKYKALRSRFRRALNECAKRGYCSKSRVGTTIYQTGDSFGGRSCICYDFTSA